MNLSEIKQDMYSISAKLSDFNRQIAFAGIALVWIFRNADGTICHNLVFPLIALVIALSLDMLQYAYQTSALAIFLGCHENKVDNENSEIIFPRCINILTWVFFGLKILAVIVGYTFILIYLFNHLIQK